jgi:asparagine synthase (glutamine-hydrolysing)
VSGVVGFVGFAGNAAERRIRSAQERLCRFSWNTWDGWALPDGSVALARVDIGIFNPQPQPVRSSDGQVIAFFSGELHGTAELRRNLVARGAMLERGDDPELVLHAYLNLGVNFVERLEGAFHLAILDLTRRELLLANDRFGLRPLYYTEYHGGLAFAPEVKALIADEAFEKKLSLVAVAEYMRFQQLLGDKTFFEDIYLLPPASLLAFDLVGNRLTLCAYWSFAAVAPLDSNTPYAVVVEESARLFQQAIDKLSSDAARVGLYLSGGLDSRLIAGCLAKRRTGFPTISYGDSLSIDVQLAKRVASVLGTKHHFFEFADGHWVRECADLHLELAEGQHSWIHSHGMTTLPEARHLLDINLTGYGVDTAGLGGHFWDNLLDRAVDDYAFDCRFFDLYNQKYQWPGLNECEEETLYTQALRSRMQGLAFDSFRNEVHRYSRYPYEQRAEYFNVLNHNRRSTQNHVIVSSSYFETRFPGYDYELLDFVYSFPQSWRSNRRLQQDVIEWIDPRLARIPQARDGLLFTRCTRQRVLHQVVMRLKQRANRRFGPVFREPSSLYADYERWLRHDLRAWAEGILFDGRLASRDIFEMSAVRSLFERHMSGNELHTIGKIAPIMTFEMIMRVYCD